MSLRRVWLLLAFCSARTCAGLHAKRFRGEAGDVSCSANGIVDRDEIVMAKLADHVCNPPLRYGQEDNLTLSCWRLVTYNTNLKFTSALFQKVTDQGPRCALVFSGLHAENASKGYIMQELGAPMEHTKVCGFHVYRPFYEYIHTHMHQPKWSEMQRALADAETCGAGVTLAGASLGGAVAEVIAACAGEQQLHELRAAYKPKKVGLFGMHAFAPKIATAKQPEETGKAVQEPVEPLAVEALPAFAVQQVYTYGAPAAAAEPLQDKSHNDTCLRGRRFFLSEDPVAIIGRLANNKHARMDADEIFVPKDGGNVTVLHRACNASDVVEDKERIEETPNGKRHDPIQSLTGERHLRMHGPPAYAEAIGWMQGLPVPKTASEDREEEEEESVEPRPVSLSEEEEEPPERHDHRHHRTHREHGRGEEEPRSLHQERRKHRQRLVQKRTASLCAQEEGAYCRCTGTVYYGRKYLSGRPGDGPTTSFEQMVEHPRNSPPNMKDVLVGIYCDNTNLGIPQGLHAYHKQCYCLEAPRPVGTVAGVQPVSFLTDRVDDWWSNETSAVGAEGAPVTPGRYAQLLLAAALS